MRSRFASAALLCLAMHLGVSGGLAAAREAPPNTASTATGPNILLILADDLGYADLGCYGSKTVRTPVIDRLAREGVQSSQFYVSTPVCAPTRVSLMTGRYPARTSLNSNPDYMRPSIGLDPQETTIAEVLKQRGYHTAIFGKWHLGYDPRFWPQRQGFDEYVGFISGWADYYTHNYRKEAGNWMVRGSTREDTEGYMTDILTREAIGCIEHQAKAGTPFFMYLAYNTPHAPIEPPPGCTKTEPAEIYDAMIEYLDRKVGEILAAIEQQGIAGNTLVVFMSDNGAEKGLGTNGPLRGRKRSVYEGGIRVPFIARFPGRIPPGTTTDQLAVSMDLFAIFAKLAGASVPTGAAIDGVDILPMLAGKAKSPRENTPLFWAFDLQDAMRQGPWKLVRMEGKPIGLYNIPNDPAESKDLSAQEPRRLRTMSARIEAWRRSMRNPAAKG